PQMGAGCRRIGVQTGAVRAELLQDRIDHLWRRRIGILIGVELYPGGYVRRLVAWDVACHGGDIGTQWDHNLIKISCRRGMNQGRIGCGRLRVYIERKERIETEPRTIPSAKKSTCSPGRSNARAYRSGR